VFGREGREEGGGLGRTLKTFDNYAVSCFAKREDYNRTEAAADSEESPEDVAEVASPSYEGQEEIS
jgi:hypothetical protein